MRVDLREATHHRHIALERRLPFSADVVSLDGYRHLLTMTAAVVPGLEPRLSDELGELFRPPHGNRSNRLLADLAALGVGSGDVPAVLLPSVPDRAAAFGAAYVLQGSLLGGATIARLVTDRLGLGPSTTSYLTVYGAGLGSAWQHFTAGLEAFGVSASDNDRDDARATALATFDAFLAALDALGIPA